MGFAQPWGLLALAALPLVVYLHRRATPRRRAVPFVALWTPAASGASARARRRSVDLLLLVRLLLVTGLAVGLARPTWAVRQPERHVIVVDASAGLLAVEGGRPRLAHAQDQARTIAAAFPPGDEVCVVHAGAVASVAAPCDADREAARRAIGALRATPTRRRLTPALAEAARLGAGRPGGVHVVTDARAPEAVRVAARRAGLPERAVHVHAVGGPADNVALVALASAPAGGSTLDHEIFVAVQNFGRTPRAVDVVVGAPDGERGRRRLVLDPGRRGTAVFPTPAAPWVDVRLDGAADALAADDHAVLALAAAPLRVRYVWRGDGFLRAALAAHPGVALAATTADALAADAVGDADLLVVDGAAPERLALPALVVGSAPGRAGARVPLGEWDRHHPLLRDLDLGELRAPEDAGGPGGRGLALARIGERVVLSVHDGGVARRVELALSPAGSGLGALPAFPVIVARAVAWLAEGVVPANVRAGDRLTLPWPEPGGATVRRPDGTTRTVAAVGGRLVIEDTDALGLWDVIGQRTRTRFAVSLLDDDTSDVDRVTAPAPEIAAPAGGRTERRDASAIPLGLAAALLGAEVWLLGRRGRTTPS